MVKRVLSLIFVSIAVGAIFLFILSLTTLRNDFSITPAPSLEVFGEKPKFSELIKQPQDYIAIDIEPQKKLENPPSIIKALYATAWSGGSSKKVNYFIDLIKNTELNALVIDIKDYTGMISYNTDLDLVKKYNAKEIKTPRINAVIKKLHDEGIYVIARIAVFQDLALAKARPEIALTSSSTGKQWQDRKGLMWVDPASSEVWDYNIAIAKDALDRGFDEVNFDYIRFASDGNMKDVIYPVWGEKSSMTKVIKSFFKYLRESLPEAKLSADLFGLTTINYDDLGIGQNLENAFPYFDAIAPMVYPSHYASGFNNYKNPALYPYEVVYKSMSEAQKRLGKYLISASTTITRIPQLRPWLQDFDLGANYDAAKVKAQIRATIDTAANCNSKATTTQITMEESCENRFGGWMMWNPSNVYTRDAFIVE